MVLDLSQRKEASIDFIKLRCSDDEEDDVRYLVQQMRMGAVRFSMISIKQSKLVFVIEPTIPRPAEPNYEDSEEDDEV